MLAAGVSRVVVGSLDPNPEARGGLERLRSSAVEVENADSFEARRQNEAWRTWVALGRPFVTYKAAMTVDGRVTVRASAGSPGRSRAVGSTSCAPRPTRSPWGWERCGSRTRASTRATSTSRASRGGWPLAAVPADGSELELRSGPLADELRALAAEGVQSLLLEGGPTLARAFLEAGLVDKLLLFVAPVISGAGPLVLDSLSEPVRLTRLTSQQVGEDVLLEAYLREP